MDLNAVNMFKIRMVVYGLLILFSFFIFVGIAVMKDRLGQCVLYCDRSGCSSSACGFPTFVAIVGLLIYPLYRVATLFLLHQQKLTTEMFLFSDLFQLIYFIADVTTGILTFISACVLTAGVSKTCDNVNCDSPAFDKEMSAAAAAQAGAWIGTILWIVLGVAGFLYLKQEGKLILPSGSTTSTQAPPTQEVPPNGSGNSSD